MNPNLHSALLNQKNFAVGLKRQAYVGQKQRYPTQNVFFCRTMRA